MKKKVLAINGSASRNSSNLALLYQLKLGTKEKVDFEIIESLHHLPHFQTELSAENTPDIILAFRNKIKNADAVIFCTPEYIFSIPSGLKNALEWCVSTTVLSRKPVGIITASANGIKGHEELQLILSTLEAIFDSRNTLLIQGVKGKINTAGMITDEKLLLSINHFFDSLSSQFFN